MKKHLNAALKSLEAIVTLEERIGLEALNALLKGEAAVVPVEATHDMLDLSYERERKEFGPLAQGLNHSAIYETLIHVGRLDKPSPTREPDTAA